jgi:putative ABC transport system permease protein
MWMLARKILLHDPFKFAVAAAGVSVSVVLVLIQIGLYLGFMQNASNVIDNSTADLWIAGEGNENFDFPGSLDERTVYRVASTPGVERAERLLLEWTQFKLSTGGVQSIELLGIERDAELLRPWHVVSGDVHDYGAIDGIVIDRTELGKVLLKGLGDRAEVGGLRARVVALTDGIRSFSSSPYVFTNVETARAYGRLPVEEVHYVLVRAAPGVDVNELKARLSQIPHVAVYTRAEYSASARHFWATRTGIAAGFFLTAALAVVIGLVIVGQILYNGTLEHIKEYGTLKAMGASNGSITRVIVYQALISAVIGIAVGSLIATLSGIALKGANLIVVLPAGLYLGNGALIFAMCCGAALASISKVFRLDPAAVFKG